MAKQNLILMVIIIDDYADIHTRQRNNTTEVPHMATVLLRIFDTPAVLAVVDGYLVNDPVGISTQVLLNCFEENMCTIMCTFVSTASNFTQQEFFNSTNERRHVRKQQCATAQMCRKCASH